MDFDTLMKAGSMLGSGGVVVVDDAQCIVKFALRTMKFYQHESCGWCIPCREGTDWLKKTLIRFHNGGGVMKDIDNMQYLSENMLGRTFKFRKEFEDHLDCVMAAGAIEICSTGGAGVLYEPIAGRHRERLRRGPGARHVVDVPGHHLPVVGRARSQRLPGIAHVDGGVRRALARVPHVTGVGAEIRRRRARYKSGRPSAPDWDARRMHNPGEVWRRIGQTDPVGMRGELDQQARG